MYPAFGSARGPWPDWCYARTVVSLADRPGWPFSGYCSGDFLFSRTQGKFIQVVHIKDSLQHSRLIAANALAAFTGKIEYSPTRKFWLE